MSVCLGTHFCWLTIDITTYVLKDLQHLFIVMVRLSIAFYPN